jgi:hypothetical protein
MLDGFRNQVERADLMPRLGQIRSHSAAHVPQADECDARHVQLPFQLPGRFSTKAVMPSF